MYGSLSLKAYTVRMNKKNRPAELAYENQTVFNVLTECLNELVTPQSSSQNPDARVFSLTGNKYKTVSGANRRVSGMLKAGTSGYSSEIISKKGNVAFSRQVTDTEVIPHYFQASIPVAARMPIICIQQFSGNGLYVFFMGMFLERLKQELKNRELTIKFNPVFLSGLYLNQFYKDGAVKRITAIAHRISSDTADGARQARIKSEILLSPVKKKDAIATLKELLTRAG